MLTLSDLHVYYGDAATSMGVAPASLSGLLAWLEANSAPDVAETEAAPAF